MKEKSSIPINQEEIAGYLKDIRRIRVMTPDREKELAKKILSPDITEQEKKKHFFPKFTTISKPTTVANPMPQR